MILLKISSFINFQKKIHNNDMIIFMNVPLSPYICSEKDMFILDNVLFTIYSKIIKNYFDLISSRMTFYFDISYFSADFGVFN